MDIRQIELFVAAAEEKHFTRAAMRANIVQSGLSGAIRALEDELGTLLFVRTTRRVELSPAGKAFLPEARRILHAVRSARDAVTEVTHGITGRLAIGTVQSLSAFVDLPFHLQRFRLDNPQVEISVKEAYLEGLADAVRQGNLDLAFMPLTGVSQTGLTVLPLFSSEMVVATAREHALVEQSEIALVELNGQAFVDFTTRWGTRLLVDQIFAVENVARHTDFEVENVELLTNFVSRGLGIAIIPRALAAQYNLHVLKIRPIKISPAQMIWGLGLYFAQSDNADIKNPAAAAFRSTIEQLAENTDHA